ncbi:MAG TPA: ABC transporter substrate-binding protein [Synechococcales cyanobacterium M55_K2018_004]|nr:ABC transporter substrate-binding protein [Synechococcales cyanobacterium M55_K2018_004]
MAQFFLRRSLGAALLAFTISLVGAGCTSTPQATEPSATTAESPAASESATLTPVKFTLSWMLQGLDAGLTQALAKGYFKEAGLDVTIERGFGSADSISKVAAGQYDIGEGDIYAMMEFNEKNPDNQLVAVAIKFNKSPLAIVSLAETGITDPKGLEGKTLAAPAGDGARRLFPVFASVTGIDPNKVTWTNVDPKLRETLLSKGEFDGISCFSTSCIPPLGKMGHPPDKLNVFYYNNFGLELYGNALIVRRAFLEEKPEVVRGFVQAYLRGLKETIQNPDAAFATVAQYAEGGVFDEALERQRLQLALDTLMVSPEVQANGVGGVDTVRLEKTIAQVVEGFGLTKTPTAAEVFNDSMLPPKEERLLN